VCCVPSIPIIVKLLGLFMQRQLRGLWGQHVYRCREDTPVVLVGVAICIIFLVYRCRMMRAGVVMLWCCFFCK
jgi:hypothetical protein